MSVADELAALVAEHELSPQPPTELTLRRQARDSGVTRSALSAVEMYRRLALLLSETVRLQDNLDKAVGTLGRSENEYLDFARQSIDAAIVASEEACARFGWSEAEFDRRIREAVQKAAHP